jgi:D-serine deaminase-like pyridoxal phosphate-dependent protein
VEQYLQKLKDMKTSLAVELSREKYRVSADELFTPTLLIYRDIVRRNIQRMITVLGGRPDHWRPHLKTVKLDSMTRLLVEAGITTAKCATTLELLMACRAGMQDVLVAYPHTGKNARRIAEIAAEFSNVRVSAIAESEEQLEAWRNTGVELFIDINAGMNRTGIEQNNVGDIARLASRIQDAGTVFRGLHFYDGNSSEPDIDQRTKRAHERYDELLNAVAVMKGRGIQIKEIITSGTPALPCSLSYTRLWDASFKHQVSPGTVVYNDASSLEQLPSEYDLEPAVLVASRVVSHPKADVITCDAGHKSVSVDSGVPNTVVLGQPALRALKPSEEHLPFEVVDHGPIPSVGSVLYLIPRHVCPTVNNFDSAAIIERGNVISIDRVTARGHEGP